MLNHHENGSPKSEAWPGLQAGELFYRLPERIEQRSLRAGAKLAFAVLKFHGSGSNDCHPSLPTLGQEIGVGEKMARAYKNELVKNHLIAEELSTGQGWANHYYPLDGERCRISWKPSKGEDFKKRHSYIPKKVMESATLSHEAKVAYGRLRRIEYIRTCPAKRRKNAARIARLAAHLPTYEELGCMVGISRHQARKRVLELEAANLLVLDRDSLGRDDEGRGGTFEFRTLPPARDWKDKARASLKRREQLRRGLPR